MSAAIIQKDVKSPVPMVYMTRRLMIESVRLNPDLPFHRYHTRTEARNVSVNTIVEFIATSVATTWSSCFIKLKLYI